MRVDLIVIGGGVVGLSIAWEAARRGARVRIIDHANVDKQASWAGAGIIPAPPGPRASQPLEHLARRAAQAHQSWADMLRDHTGLDTGYQRCGGLFIADQPGEAASLAASRWVWEEEGFEFQRWDNAKALGQAPQLGTCPGWSDVRTLIWTPGEAQLRNPRHLQALRLAITRLGSEVLEEAVRDIAQVDGQWQVRTSRSAHTAASVCVAAGAWTGTLIGRFGIATEVVPVRGQMLLHRFDRPIYPFVLNVGSRYLVSRADGHLLVGSTEEEAGFDARTTEEGLRGLEEFATRWLPQELQQGGRLPPPIASWAGLRPASIDGFPVMGPVAEHEGLFVAAGHFRAGLTLSPAIAEVIVDMLEQKQPAVDVRAFRPERGWKGSLTPPN